MLADPSLFATAGAATAAAGDAGNLIALADLEGQDLFSGGTRTAAEAMGDIYTSVGRQAAQAELDRAGNAVRLDDLSSLRESISGVDLDEEAANLLQWQAAYQAAARVVTATNDMVGVLMDMGR
jgi:flagellar hook-associated protein 1 FlgK